MVHIYKFAAVLFAFVFVSSSAFAQKKVEIETANNVSSIMNDEDEGLFIGRPIHEDVYDESGIRRMPKKVGSRATAALPATGSPVIPVVLVEFSDRKFSAAGKTPEEIKATYELFFNSKDKAEVKAKINSYGSVSDYFNDQSNGAFTPQFVILGPFTLSKNYAYYGANSGETIDANLYSRFLPEAMNLAKNGATIDWDQFDNDKNGSVDMIFFIHAGWGENTVSTTDPDAIWAKEMTTPISVTDENGNKTTFATSAICAEARVKSNATYKADVTSGQFGTTGYNPDNLRVDGIGVCVHELSHALGLPDFYDTKYVAFGMDLWSIMDFGEYANNGYTPAGYNAYERDFMGWQTLEVLSDTTELTIACFAEGGKGYKIINDLNEDEYYVIENRQPKGWDTSLGKKGTGLQVTHVDYNSSAWESNKVNVVPNHQRMTIIAANNLYIGSTATSDTEVWNKTLAGNLFPYTTPYQSLTNTTSPASVAYAGGYMNKPLYDITRNEDGTITVYFLKSKAEFDAQKEAVSIDEVDFTGMLDVYGLNGMHICRCTRDELHRISFRHGIYLIKNDQNAVKKVLLK